MQGLLTWLGASPVRAGLVAAALALSGLFDIFGAGLIAFVALRRGVSHGLLAALVALPLIVAAGLFSGLGTMFPLAVFGLWTPVLVLSHVLRRTGSLALAMQAGAIIAGLVLAGWYLLSPEPLAAVRAFLEQQVLPLVERVEGTEPKTDLDKLVRLAPGFLAAGSLLVATVALLIGRWWQAIAYNPGGFRRDFHRLRQGRSAAIAIAVLVLAAALSGQPVVIGLALAGTLALLFQGIALVHGVVAATRQSVLWLWAFYGALLVLPLPVTLVSAVLGGVDNWMDFRRLAGPGAANSNE